MDFNGHGFGTRDSYNVHENFGISRHEAKDQVKMFNASAHIGFIPALRDATYWINRIHEELGYRFIAVTSLSEDPYAQKLRTKNLRKLFGKAFQEFHYLACGADKDEILAELSKAHKGRMWIEDKPANYIAGEKVGFDCYLMEHAHNMEEAHQRSMAVVKNWEEVYHVVKRKSKT
jgi:hypothetical protein